MNFISLAVTTFISNYIFMAIIRWLPIKNKRLWQGILVSIADVGTMINYLIIGLTNFEIVTFLYNLGNILGILLAYIASMMMILDGIVIFKSRRLREFERNINNKEGKSVPRNILGIIFLGLAIMLLAFGIVSSINYDNSLLTTVIGSFIGSAIALGLALFFFITGKAQHKSIKASNLLFMITLPNKKLIYTKMLTKEFTENEALGQINNIYMLDEYGLLVTPNEKYIVKGIKVNDISDDYLNMINMDINDENKFRSALDEFQKYNRKKIILDENNNIVKITMIK